VELSVNNGKLQKTVEKNEEKIREVQRVTDSKIDNLYARTNEHEAAIASMASSVNALAQTCTRIETKLDRLIERGS